jgi:hypothetical protein
MLSSMHILENLEPSVCLWNKENTILSWLLCQWTLTKQIEVILESKSEIANTKLRD